jgi:hypothetical protein
MRYDTVNSMEQTPPWEAKRHSASQEIPRIIWNPQTITVFTRARQWSLNWDSWIQFKHSYPTSLRSILILSSHLRLGLPSGIFLSGLSTKIFNAYHAFCMPAHLIPVNQPSSIWWSAQLTELIVMQSSPASCHFYPFRSKYSPQHIRHIPFSYNKSYWTEVGERAGQETDPLLTKRFVGNWVFKAYPTTLPN